MYFCETKSTKSLLWIFHASFRYVFPTWFPKSQKLASHKKRNLHKEENYRNNKTSIHYKTKIPYFFTFLLMDHFFDSNGNKILRTRCEIYTRVMGYYRPVTQFNNGKKSEFYTRKYYDEITSLANTNAIC